MRQGQNQRRTRGRGRRQQNPLSRNMESNGPDVKIRGTAQHINEKYQVLARDAQSSGDRIGAENYLQHAEHYFRLIQAHQSSMEQQQKTDSDERRERPDEAQAIPDQEGADAAAPASSGVDENGREDHTDGEGESKPRRPARRRQPRAPRAQSDGKQDSNDSEAPQSRAEAPVEDAGVA